MKTASLQAQFQLRRWLLDRHNSPLPPKIRRNWSWWLAVSLNIALLLAGQTAATLLNRYYHDQGGGNSKWFETVTFSAAFPILYIPLIFFRSYGSTPRSPSTHRVVALSATYTAIGVLVAADSLMYSHAALYLSASTYALLCATQLAFNAVLSYIINSEKFSHLTLNSVVLLTVSAAVVGLRQKSDSASADPQKVPLGFILTLAASATYSLILSLMELSFDRVIKSPSFSAVLDMQIYTAMASNAVAFIGMFTSGEWRSLGEEMAAFKKGRAGWWTTVVGTAVVWQARNVGLVGLISEVSSLFSNAISTLAVPVVPVFAVVLFGDETDGVKVIALLLGLWGFASYFYQQYLDYRSERKDSEIGGGDGVGAIHES